MTHLTQSPFLLTYVPSRIAAFFKEIIAEYKKARSVSKTIKELNKLTNSELRDIGLTRGEIHDVAFKTHYEDK